MGELELSTLAQNVVEAHDRIKTFVRNTPLEYSALLSKKSGVNVNLKLESEQISGSFKVRGGFNKILKHFSDKSKHTDTQPNIFTASSGNHGLAMTLALKAVGVQGTIYVPKTVAASKENMLKLHDAKIVKFGNDCVETEQEAQRVAKEQKGMYISPYNDLDIIAGQGTIAFEILQSQKQVDAIFITVGGGGLISGIASYAKHILPSIEIVGCSPINSNAMEMSVKRGKQIDIDNKDTLSDGSAGNIDHGSITFPLCQRYVDQWVSVTEDEIAYAIYLMMEVHHKIIEGAAGVALASFLKVKDNYKGKTVAIVLCGCNIGMEKLIPIINNHT